MPQKPRKQGVNLMSSELPEQRPVSWRYQGSEMVIRPASPYILMLDEPVARAIQSPAGSVKIRGWAYLEDTPLTLHVLVGGYEVAAASCGIYRGDVVHYFGDIKSQLSLRKTDGNVGFDVELPVTVGRGQKVELRFTDSSGMVRAVHLLSYGSSEIFRRMFLVHIPKTGGSSVNAFMEDYLGRRACASHIEGNPEWEFSPASTTLTTFGTTPDIENYVFLSGHVPLYELRQKLMLGNTLVTTVLRDPIEQVVAHIAWIRSLADPDEKERFYQHDTEIRNIATCLAELDLRSPVHLKKWAEDLSYLGRSLFDNSQVRYLTDRAPTDQVTQCDLQGAIRNLQVFDLIGRTDRVPAFLTKVAEKMGFERCGISDVNVRENVAIKKYGLDSRDPGVREALESLIQFDQALYDKAVSSESIAL